MEREREVLINILYMYMYRCTYTSSANYDPSIIYELFFATLYIIICKLDILAIIILKTDCLQFTISLMKIKRNKIF